MSFQDTKQTNDYKQSSIKSTHMTLQIIDVFIDESYVNSIVSPISN